MVVRGGVEFVAFSQQFYSEKDNFEHPPLSPLTQEKKGEKKH